MGGFPSKRGAKGGPEGGQDFSAKSRRAAVPGMPPFGIKIAESRRAAVPGMPPFGIKIAESRRAAVPGMPPFEIKIEKFRRAAVPGMPPFGIDPTGGQIDFLGRDFCVKQRSTLLTSF